MFGLLKSLSDWTLGFADSGWSTLALAVDSFTESIFFPIPPDALLIPMVLADRAKAFRIALVCTIASVLGGMLGYAIGLFLFEEVGRAVLELYGYAPKFAEFQAKYNEWGAWAVFIAGVTPFPYKVITILSGVTALDLFVFTIASVAARGLRFFIVAALLWKFGDPIRDFIEKYLSLLFVLFCVLLAGGFVAV